MSQLDTLTDLASLTPDVGLVSGTMIAPSQFSVSLTYYISTQLNPLLDCYHG